MSSSSTTSLNAIDGLTADDSTVGSTAATSAGSSTFPSLQSTTTSYIPSVTAHNGQTPAAALTTIFTAPVGCPSVVTMLPDQLSCLPPNYSGYWYGGIGFYSPAICPTGYTVGCSRQGTGGPGVESTETAMSCCPSQYACATSSASAGMCVKTGSPNAYGLQIRWAASDLTNLQTDPLKALVISTSSSFTSYSSSTNISPPKSSASNAANSSSSSNAGGLSLYAKAGIGAGLGFLLVVMAIYVCFIIDRRKKKEVKAELESPGSCTDSQGKGESDHADNTPNVETEERGVRPLLDRSSINSKRSSHARTNSALALAPLLEETQNGRNGHISWQPEVVHREQREITLPEPYSPGIGPSRREEETFGLRSETPALRSPSSEILSGRTSLQMEQPATGRITPLPGRASPAAHGRASPAPNLDLTSLGTTMTPDVEPDQFRTPNDTWLTFFHPEPIPSTPPLANTKYLAGAASSSKQAEVPLMNPEEDRIEGLRRQRLSLEDRRQRLMQLDRLDEELDRVNLLLKQAESERKRKSRVERE